MTQRAIADAPPRRMLWPALAVAATLILLTGVALLAARNAILSDEIRRLQFELAQRPAPPILAVWLAPRPTPAGATTSPRVREADVTQGLQVTLAFPPALPATAVISIAVRDTDGRTVWSSPALTPESQSVTANLPASILRRGDYEIVLQGGARIDALQDLASYALRIAGAG